LCVAIVTMVALILRPLSTLVLALVCCVPIALALRSRVRTFRQAGVLASRALATMMLIVAIVIPLSLYFFYDDVAPIISSVEFHLKKDVIGGQSNMDFRLAILKLAFTQIENTSFWYGSALAGSHTVPLSQVPGFGWWWSVMGNAEAAIHSDFVSVFVLMGIAGYIVISIALYVALADRFRELRRRDLLGSGVVLHSIAIIGLVALIIYCSDQPYLSYYNHAQSVWMLLLISEVARRSKIAG
jgi:hypothetical protein